MINCSGRSDTFGDGDWLDLLARLFCLHRRCCFPNRARFIDAYGLYQVNEDMLTEAERQLCTVVTYYCPREDREVIIRMTRSVPRLEQCIAVAATINSIDRCPFCGGRLELVRNSSSANPRRRLDRFWRWVRFWRGGTKAESLNGSG